MLLKGPELVVTLETVTWVLLLGQAVLTLVLLVLVLVLVLLLVLLPLLPLPLLPLPLLLGLVTPAPALPDSEAYADARRLAQGRWGRQLGCPEEPVRR